MKQNFAGQPDGGGALGYAGPFPTLTGLDLMSDVSKPQSAIFRPDPRFVDNCKNCNSMKNAEGDSYSYAYDYQQYDNYDNQGNPVNNSPALKPKNNTGGFSWGSFNVADILGGAVKIGTDVFKSQNQKDQAALALQIEAQKAAQKKADLEAAKAKSGSVATTIKAYTTPIIIVGVLSIAGIAAYFYFKKKKVN
jgi:hypothetical protein